MSDISALDEAMLVAGNLPTMWIKQGKCPLCTAGVKHVGMRKAKCPKCETQFHHWDETQGVCRFSKTKAMNNFYGRPDRHSLEFVQEDYVPKKCKATDARPGTKKKILVMQWRAARGQEITNVEGTTWDCCTGAVVNQVRVR